MVVGVISDPNSDPNSDPRHSPKKGPKKKAPYVVGAFFGLFGCPAFSGIEMTTRPTPTEEAA